MSVLCLMLSKHFPIAFCDGWRTWCPVTRYHKSCGAFCESFPKRKNIIENLNPYNITWSVMYLYYFLLSDISLKLTYTQAFDLSTPFSSSSSFFNSAAKVFYPFNSGCAPRQLIYLGTSGRSRREEAEKWVQSGRSQCCWTERIVTALSSLSLISC